MWLDSSMQQRGLSPAAFARSLGVADAQVSRWRRGQVVPTVQSLQRIADVFGVPRASLDRLAGYPVSAEGGDEADAELEASTGRLRELLETLPPSLRPAYIDACTALAQTLAAAVEALHAEVDGGRPHTIGFRPGG